MRYKAPEMDGSLIGSIKRTICNNYIIQEDEL